MERYKDWDTWTQERSRRIKDGTLWITAREELDNFMLGYEKWRLKNEKRDREYEEFCELCKRNKKGLVSDKELMDYMDEAFLKRLATPDNQL